MLVFLHQFKLILEFFLVCIFDWRYFLNLLNISPLNFFCRFTCFIICEEREWGSGIWLIIYIASGIGSSIFSCIFSPDNLSVGSSGTS